MYKTLKPLNYFYGAISYETALRHSDNVSCPSTLEHNSMSAMRQLEEDWAAEGKAVPAACCMLKIPHGGGLVRFHSFVIDAPKFIYRCYILHTCTVQKHLHVRASCPRKTRDCPPLLPMPMVVPNLHFWCPCTDRVPVSSLNCGHHRYTYTTVYI